MTHLVLTIGLEESFGNMPLNVVKTQKDEAKWKKAEEIAAKAGQEGNYAYVMGIYKKMKPDYKFKKTASLESMQKELDKIASFFGLFKKKTPIQKATSDLSKQLKSVEKLRVAQRAKLDRLPTPITNSLNIPSSAESASRRKARLRLEELKKLRGM